MNGVQNFGGGLNSPNHCVKKTLVNLKQKAQKLAKLFSGSNSNTTVFDGFTLAEVLMANEERGEKSITFLSRTNEPKAPFNKIKNLMAFTLAEVLITLAIIGIVAALTIPTVITNYQHHQYIVQLKKAQNTLSQAIMTARANGENFSLDFDSNGVVNNNDYTYLVRGNRTSQIDALKKYLKIQNTTIEPYDYENCTNNGKTCNAPILYDMDGSQISERFYELNSNTNNKILLLDGTFLVFDSQFPILIAANWSKDTIRHNIFSVVVDVNGPFKKPNKIGYDVFAFYLADTGNVTPAGANASVSKTNHPKFGERYILSGDNGFCNNVLPAAYGGKHLCCTASAISGRNPDGTEYFKGIKYWADIK